MDRYASIQMLAILLEIVFWVSLGPIGYTEGTSHTKAFNRKVGIFHLFKWVIIRGGTLIFYCFRKQQIFCNKQCYHYAFLLLEGKSWTLCLQVSQQRNAETQKSRGLLYYSRVLWLHQIGPTPHLPYPFLPCLLIPPSPALCPVPVLLLPKLLAQHSSCFYQSFSLTIPSSHFPYIGGRQLPPPQCLGISSRIIQRTENHLPNLCVQYMAPQWYPAI